MDLVGIGGERTETAEFRRVDVGELDERREKARFEKPCVWSEREEVESSCSARHFCCSSCERIINEELGARLTLAPRQSSLQKRISR